MKQVGKMAAVSDVQFLEYMSREKLEEFLKHTQYSILLLNAQPIENVRKVLTTYFASLKKIDIGRVDAAMGKQRAIAYKLMHNVLIRKIKRKLSNNPNKEARINRFVAPTSPELLDMAIIVELDSILPDLITDCVVERVPLDGLRDLRTKVAKIRAAYDSAGFKVVDNKLRF